MSRSRRLHICLLRIRIIDCDVWSRLAAEWSDSSAPGFQGRSHQHHWWAG